MQEPKELTFNGETFWGFKKPCPNWLKKKYKEVVNYKCEDCGLKEDENNTLEIHRIKKEIDGGYYVVCPKNHPLNNIKVLCKACHKKYNYGRKTGDY